MISQPNTLGEPCLEVEKGGGITSGLILKAKEKKKKKVFPMEFHGQIEGFSFDIPYLP